MGLCQTRAVKVVGSSLDVCENVLIWMRNVSGNGRLRRSITGPASVIMDVLAATLVSRFIQEVLRG